MTISKPAVPLLALLMTLGTVFAGQVIRSEVLSSGSVTILADIPKVFWSVVRSMATDAQGRLWIGSFGAGTWVVEEGQPVRVLGKNGKMPSLRVSKLVAGKDRMWLATAGDGIWYFDLARKDWFPMTPDPGNDMKFLHAFLVEPDGEMFVGSVGTGAAHLKDGKWKPVWKKEGLNCNWINDAVKTVQGIWTCGTDGVFLYRDGSIVKSIFPECPGASDGYWGDPSVNLVLPMEDKLVLGTAMNGVVIIDADGTQTQVSGTTKDIQGMAAWKGFLWACGPGGAWRITCQEKTMDVQKLDGPWEKDCPFKSMTVTEGDRLVIGTNDGRIYESTDGKTFRLFISFKNGDFVKM